MWSESSHAVPVLYSLIEFSGGIRDDVIVLLALYTENLIVQMQN